MTKGWRSLCSKWDCLLRLDCCKHWQIHWKLWDVAGIPFETRMLGKDVKIFIMQPPYLLQTNMSQTNVLVPSKTPVWWISQTPSPIEFSRLQQVKQFDWTVNVASYMRATFCFFLRHTHTDMGRAKTEFPENLTCEFKQHGVQLNWENTVIRCEGSTLIRCAV